MFYYNTLFTNIASRHLKVQGKIGIVTQPFSIIPKCEENISINFNIIVQWILVLQLACHLPISQSS